jgi:spermidine synthase
MICRKPLLLALAGLLAACAAAVAAPKVLYEKASPYNKIVVTEDEEGLRTLSFGNGVRQSVVKPGDPDRLELRYARAMPAALALVEEPRRVLIVGLGGGTIPSFLHKHYPRTTIDVVDIDPDVVAVAKRFFGFREDSLMHAHVADGRKFIEQCRDPYDVIFLDAFGPDSTPHQLATREFFQAVRRALTPKGIVAGNVFSEGLNPLYNSMVRTYQDVFREVYIMDVPGAGNKILIGLPWQGRFRPDDVARRARQIAKEKQFGFDMGDLVASGFRPAAEINPAVYVLTDKDKP